MADTTQTQAPLLQDWANTHEPGDTMIFKDSFWDQIMFVRDRIHRLLVSSYEAAKVSPVRVISTHTSKSIKLPVYHINVEGLEVVIRYNFHDWKISIKSDRPVPDNFHRLFNRTENVHRVYCEGFPSGWVFESYSRNPKQFTVEIGSTYDVYTFFYLLSEGLGLRPDQH